MKSLIKQSDGMSVLIERFRSSNLIRHNLVSWPLANYTKYKGDLTEENLYSKMHGIPLDNDKLNKTLDIFMLMKSSFSI